jgi:hypothetical protein
MKGELFGVAISHDKISHDDERQWQKNLPKEG